MIRPLTALFLAGFIAFASGCCGPMWQPGGCGSSCGDGSCGGLASNCGGCQDGCGSCQGCGELYIDPWINHPADCCDPCDACGNFNGQSCGKCRSVFAGVKSLWGYRCDDGCDGGCAGECGGCQSSGCSTCGTSDCGCDSGTLGDQFLNGEIIGGEVIHGSLHSGNGSAIQTHMDGPQITRRPSRETLSSSKRQSRQIFQPRRVSQQSPSLAY